MTVTRILGLDPGLASLGFGAITVMKHTRPPSVALIDFGIIQTPARTEIGSRLQTIYEDLHSLLDEIKPDLVAIEQLFFYKMGKNSKEYLAAIENIVRADPNYIAKFQQDIEEGD